MGYKVRPIKSCAKLFDLVIEKLEQQKHDIRGAWGLAAAQHDNHKTPSGGRKQKKRTQEGWSQVALSLFTVRFRYGIDEKNKTLWVNWIDPPGFWFEADDD